MFQAAGEVINIIMQPIVAYIQNRSRPQSILAASPSIFNWPQEIVGLIDVILHLIVAGLLILWLYRNGKVGQPAAAAPSMEESKAQS